MLCGLNGRVYDIINWSDDIPFRYSVPIPVAEAAYGELSYRKKEFVLKQEVGRHAFYQEEK